MELDVSAIQSAIVAGLPTHARWIIRGTPLDFDFADARRGLRKLTNDDVLGGIDEEWSDLLVFGQSDYSEGGGASPWIAIRRNDGAVCGLDVEREVATFLFNSSIERFIRTFALLNQHLGKGHRAPSNIEARVRAIDPDAYPFSEWRLLIDHLTAA
jgi:hypothetical protein